MQQPNFFVRLASGFITVAATMLVLPLVHADEPYLSGGAVADSGTSRFGLGLAASYTSGQYRGKDDTTALIPLVLYDNRYVHVFGNTVDLKLPSFSTFTFALRAKYALGDGYKAGDSNYLAGMAERKGGVWLGGAATWKGALATVSAQWLKAPSDSKGQEVELSAEHHFNAGPVQLTPHVSVKLSDKKYVDYYYGVPNDETRAGRPVYLANTSATEDTIGLRATYPFNRHQLLLLDVTDTRRSSAISDSPLVDKKLSPSLKFGYLYSF